VPKERQNTSASLSKTSLTLPGLTFLWLNNTRGANSQWTRASTMRNFLNSAENIKKFLES
jgi:hypothetical protein